MNDYARPMPFLGFDPAPGDAALTKDLARRHFQIAQEVQQVLALIGRLDLSPWQGQAGNAMRAVRDTFPPALHAMAGTAQELQAASSSWANQLSGFQAEADALERKAAAASAQQQALRVKQAALPPGSATLTADLQAASAAVSGIQSQARELHQRYLAAASRTAGKVEEHSGLWGKTEPVRTILEAVLAPFDMVAADHWVNALKEVAGVPAEWVSEVGAQIDGAESLAREGKSAEAVELLIKAGYLAESAGGKYDAWYAFAPGWLRTSAGALTEIKGFSYSLSGLGILADVGTVISPQNSGSLGDADRGVAALNGGLLAADMIMAEFPVIGEVAIAATGVYLASDYLYRHWTPFRDVANEAGHATVKVADDLGHDASSKWHSVTSAIGSWF